MPVLPLFLKKERGVRDSGRGELAVSVPATITLISPHLPVAYHHF